MMFDVQAIADSIPYLIVQIVSMSLTYLFGAFASNLTTDAVVPVSGTNMGSIQLPNGDTRLYYQDQHNGSIIEMVISNAFTIGVFEESAVLVPASQVRSNSPVAVSLVADGDTFVQVCSTTFHHLPRIGDFQTLNSQ